MYVVIIIFISQFLTIMTVYVFQGDVQDHLFELVQKAYTSIHVDNFSVFVGMDAENALQGKY